MFASKDPAHMTAISKMMQLMQLMQLMRSGGMDDWMREKEELFNSL